MIRKRSSISVSVKAAVGSSMIRTSELNESALAISTICWVATVRFDTRVRGSRSSRSVSRSLRALSFSLRSSRNPSARRGSRPMKMFCATVRWGIKLSSWWIMLIPSCWAARGLGISTSAPL